MVVAYNQDCGIFSKCNNIKCKRVAMYRRQMFAPNTLTFWHTCLDFLKVTICILWLSLLSFRHVLFQEFWILGRKEYFKFVIEVLMPIFVERLATSNNIAEQYFFSSSDLSILLVILWTWPIVQCSFRKQNWSCMRFFLWLVLLSSAEVCRNFVWWGGFSGFESINTSVTFQGVTLCSLN